MVRPEIDSSPFKLHTVLNHRLLGIEAFVTKTIPRRLTGEFVSGLPGVESANNQSTS
jgi:hypothetical protein